MSIASLLDDLYGRSPLFAVARNMAGLVAPKALALIFLDPRLPAVLRRVAFSIAVNALDVSSVARRRPGRDARRPRRKTAGTSWTLWAASRRSSSGWPTSHELLGDKRVNLGGLLVGS